MLEGKPTLKDLKNDKKKLTVAIILAVWLVAMIVVGTVLLVSYFNKKNKAEEIKAELTDTYFVCYSPKENFIYSHITIEFNKNGEATYANHGRVSTYYTADDYVCDYDYKVYFKDGEELVKVSFMDFEILYDKSGHVEGLRNIETKEMFVKYNP